ncbi:helix-turn-helix domain-containing protein [Paenibacillus pinihumi]|uniref:helix-turn-helix domain-containing protein n=1 Tax=Paenibacillus pinihumi TaxID=669462 RepID=UPI0004176B31|nr:AraC family transcriptional regulator [Paenibacillus pinihumi]
MIFRQLAQIMPYPHSIMLHNNNQILHCLPGCHAIMVVRQGHVVVSTAGDGSRTVCTQGYACHARSGPYAIEVPKTREAEYAVIQYKVLPENSEWTLEGQLGTYSEVKIHYMVDELLRSMQLPERNLEHAAEDAEELYDRRFRGRMMLERILYIYLHESLMKAADLSATRPIQESISYLNEHYMLQLTLSQLANRAGVSEGHYTVLFKKETGMTMTSYLRQLRIEKAKQLLLQVDLPAKDVAQRVGFTDYFYFSRMFKQAVGASPTAFKKQAGD